MKPFPYLALLACLFVGCAGSSGWRAYQQGRAAAEQDIARGILVQWQSGCCLPGLGAAEYRQMMADRYGVALRYDDCRVPRKREIWRNGYNDTARRIIESRWGTNIWDATRNDAERRARRASMPPSLSWGR